MQDAEIQDHVEHDLAFYLGFGDMNEVDIKEFNYLSYLNMQTDIFYKKFIKHLKENDVKKLLVTRSQDKHVSETRSGNLDDDETDLHLLLTGLCNDLKLQQRIKLRNIIELAMRSALRRSANSSKLDMKTHTYKHFFNAQIIPNQ